MIRVIKSEHLTFYRYADDLKYLFGLHPIGEFDKNKDDLEMEQFYPMVTRKFIKMNEMDGICWESNQLYDFLDWIPTDEYGRNYMWMKFLSDPKYGKILDSPRMISGEFFRPLETHFWIEQLGKINNDTEKKSKNTDKDIAQSESPSLWIAFWVILGVCVILAIALSTIIVFWLTINLRALGLVVKNKDGVI